MQDECQTWSNCKERQRTLQINVLGLDFTPGFHQDRCAFHHIAQLTNISRPVMLRENLQRAAAQCSTREKFSDKQLSKIFKIVHPVTQRGKVNRKHREEIIQVISKLLLPDEFLDVGI